jgi:hypothetical protein
MGLSNKVGNSVNRVHVTIIENNFKLKRAYEIVEGTKKMLEGVKKSMEKGFEGTKKMMPRLAWVG